MFFGCCRQTPGCPLGFCGAGPGTLTLMSTVDTAGSMRSITRTLVLVGGLLLGFSLLVLAAPAASAVEPEDSVGVVDTTSGFWWLRDGLSGETTSFYYGVPGDEPFAGDWDCDGVDTPGLYRRSTGFVYIRDANTQGIADVSYYFGVPGDIPLAGDFDGDGCDSVSIYRPSTSEFHIINSMRTAAADYSYVFGDPADKPFLGDFDGDGVDTVGMRRSSSAYTYFKNSHTGGAPDGTINYGNPGDVVATGSWQGGPDTVGLYRPSNVYFYLGDGSGQAIDSFQYGARTVTPISGVWGSLPGGDAPPSVDARLVSEFTTYHPCCQSRNININLIADMVDGAVVMPGETFSLNGHVGERTEEKGFVRAGAIIGGVVYCCDSPINIGGGTSQFATTLYNAIFFGAYEDVYHRPHSLYFNRYPVVREATLSFPGPDVQFRNDTAFPVTIRTEHTSRSITVKLHGNNEGRSVETWTVGSVSSTYGGTATVYRTITYASGTSHTQLWTHRYRQAL
jgi:hypothetical protein